MPLTGTQKTNYNQLLTDAATLKNSLSIVDADQLAVKIALNMFEQASERVKDHKGKG